MPNVLKELSSWASTLPFWEQLALEKIVTKGVFSDADCDECLQYLLEDAELTPHKSIRPSLSLSQLAENQTTKPSQPTILRKLSNLQNINALVSGQTLTFGPQLTIVFGANGSGKSGYARLIATAAFTRSDKEVLRDIHQPSNPAQELSADIEILENGTSRTVHYTVGQRLQELASFYVFDSTSVRSHLTRSHQVSFSPAGLSLLTMLANATEQVRAKLQSVINQKAQVNHFREMFVGITRVSIALAELDSNSNTTVLREFANLTVEETRK